MRTESIGDKRVSNNLTTLLLIENNPIETKKIEGGLSWERS